MKKFILLYAAALAISVAFGLAYGISLSHLLPQWKKWFVLGLILGVSYWSAGILESPRQGPWERPVAVALFILSTLLIFLCLPVLLIYWVTTPIHYALGAKLAVLLSVSSCGIIYYVPNRNKFPETRDRIAYFLGIFGAAAVVIAILL